MLEKNLGLRFESLWLKAVATWELKGAFPTKKTLCQFDGMRRTRFMGEFGALWGYQQLSRFSKKNSHRTLLL